MSRRWAVFLVALAVAGAALTGYVVFRRSGPRASVTVTLRLSAAPAEHLDFVRAQVNSARFKYEIGQKAGLKPVLAQKLSVRPVPQTSLLEMKVAVQTRAEGRRYADAFVEVLQAQCGPGVELRVVECSIR